MLVFQTFFGGQITSFIDVKEVFSFYFLSVILMSAQNFESIGNTLPLSRKIEAMQPKDSYIRNIIHLPYVYHDQQYTYFMRNL